MIASTHRCRLSNKGTRAAPGQEDSQSSTFQEHTQVKTISPSQGHTPVKMIPPSQGHTAVMMTPPRQGHTPVKRTPPSQGHIPVKMTPPRQGHTPVKMTPPRQGYTPVKRIPPRQEHTPVKTIRLIAAAQGDISPMHISLQWKSMEQQAGGVAVNAITMCQSQSQYIIQMT